MTKEKEIELSQNKHNKLLERVGSARDIFKEDEERNIERAYLNGIEKGQNSQKEKLDYVLQQGRRLIVGEAYGLEMDTEAYDYLVKEWEKIEKETKELQQKIKGEK